MFFGQGQGQGQEKKWSVRSLISRIPFKMPSRTFHLNFAWEMPINCAFCIIPHISTRQFMVHRFSPRGLDYDYSTCFEIFVKVEMNFLERKGTNFDLNFISYLLLVIEYAKSVQNSLGWVWYSFNWNR